MISKAKQKFLKSLQSKKNRYKHQSFLVQGTKSVLELLRSGFQTTILLATPEFISSNGPFNQEFEVIEVGLILRQDLKIGKQLLQNYGNSVRWKQMKLPWPWQE